MHEDWDQYYYSLKCEQNEIMAKSESSAEYKFREMLIQKGIGSSSYSRKEVQLFDLPEELEDGRISLTTYKRLEINLNAEEEEEIKEVKPRKRSKKEEVKEIRPKKKSKKEEKPAGWDTYIPRRCARRRKD